MTSLIPEPIKNLGVDAKEIILERLKNPLINFYIFFIIIFNWDILLYLFFSVDSIEVKISMIEVKYHEKDIWWIFNWRFLSPLLYAIFSSLFFQLLALLYNYCSDPISVKRYDKFCDVEEANATSYARVIKARTQNKEKEDFEKEILTLKEEIEILKNRNIDLLNDVKELSTKTHNNILYSDSDLDFENSLDDKTKRVLFNLIFDEIQMPKMKYNGQFDFIEYVINELEETQPFSFNELADIFFFGLQNLYLETIHSQDLIRKSISIKEKLKNNASKVLFYLEQNNIIEKDDILSRTKGFDFYNLR